MRVTQFDSISDNVMRWQQQQPPPPNALAARYYAIAIPLPAIQHPYDNIVPHDEQGPPALLRRAKMRWVTAYGPRNLNGPPALMLQEEEEDGGE